MLRILILFLILIGVSLLVYEPEPGRLSENFFEAEFACPCCGQTEVDPRLVKGLQKFREALGEPLFISSGYRCPKHNRAVGGRGASAHLSGKAADVFAHGFTATELFRRAAAFSAFRNWNIGVYPDRHFLHLEVGTQPKRWVKRRTGSQTLNPSKRTKE